jgi:copper homeostasis protein (lipoprotein)
MTVSIRVSLSRTLMIACIFAALACASRSAPDTEMRGMYVYMADAALFTECVTGKRYPVAFEGDSVSLERAYLEVRQQPGVEVLVSLEGRIAERPAMEGNQTEPSLVVERFISVWPGETCGARGSVSELENNYWKLTRLGDQPIPTFDGQREPHLVFHSEEGRVAGTGGCNQMSGGYEVDGTSIAFGLMASTMMACPDGNDVDQVLMAALEKATSFRKTAHHLELLDDEESVVARFEAREMP